MTGTVELRFEVFTSEYHSLLFCCYTPIGWCIGVVSTQFGAPG